MASVVEGIGEGIKQRVLIVDDSPQVRQELRTLLPLAGDIEIVGEAANGREALAVLEQRYEGIALVLSDVVMPEMGGKALLQALRERERAVPVVMLTGHPLEKEMEELRAQGMADWLPKPPELEQLAEVIARALETS